MALLWLASETSPFKALEHLLEPLHRLFEGGFFRVSVGPDDDIAL